MQEPSNDQHSSQNATTPNTSAVSPTDSEWQRQVQEAQEQLQQHATSQAGFERLTNDVQTVHSILKILMSIVGILIIVAWAMLTKQFVL